MQGYKIKAEETLKRVKVRLTRIDKSINKELKKHTIMGTLENGLIVDFKNSNIYAVEAFIENSEFYGYEIEDGNYLFPSQKSEYDILEKALTDEFNKWRINSFTFEGI